MRYTLVHSFTILVAISIASIGESVEGNHTMKTPLISRTRQRRFAQEIQLPHTLNENSKRQIIKIPPNVSRVKFVQPLLNFTPNKPTRRHTRYSPVLRNGIPWKSADRKSHSDPVNLFHDLKRIKSHAKKTEKRPLFTKDEFDPAENPGKMKNHKGVVATRGKKAKKNALGEYLVHFETEEYVRAPEFDSSKIRYDTEESQSVYGSDSAGSKRGPPPNFGSTMQTRKPQSQFFDESYVPGLSVKKLPTKGRQIQSLFSQQYTTHNPHVTTNLGLEDYGPHGLQYESYVRAFPFSYDGEVAAATHQMVTSLPGNAPGTQPIQPAQFLRDVTVSHPSNPSQLVSSLGPHKEETSSQKATIRDILDQDCPSFDAKGYCDSPPRYPMHQIKHIIKKCADLMDAMNTQPFDEPYGFAERSDGQEERINQSLPAGFDGREEPSVWSRSASDGQTACTTDFELIEPGYGKEVRSGRWFVIVQHPDTVIQRMTTETCRAPGKPCNGLSDLKCSKINSFPSKSTQCTQRHTYHRLISWDPETPEECPRMRIFRFPSACVCHVGVI